MYKSLLKRFDTRYEKGSQLQQSLRGLEEGAEGEAGTGDGRGICIES